MPSALPELETDSEEDEVGYRIDGWSEKERGRLIVRLNDLGIEHRFEDEELVVDAADESRVDDLVALLGEGAGAVLDDELDNGDSGDTEEDQEEFEPEVVEEDDEDFTDSVRLLADAATRLRLDPTDMQADADVAQASASVFLASSFGPFNEEEWSAIGRVTRRLLAALGAEEALEDQIRQEAGVLEKLLAPLGSKAEAGPGDAGPTGERTVYELAEWLPDQRAQLGFLLEQADIDYAWEGDDLLVPSAREDEVEELFDQVAGGGEDDDDGGEARYEAVAELFAASGRLAGDPTDETRQEATLRWIEASEGPPLLGMDEVDWYRIRSRARLLATAIEGGHDPNEIFEHANQLHDLLRAVV